MSDVRAFMIGPKAENLEFFRHLIVQALDDHLYWRRNFFPEDSPGISSIHQHAAPFQAFQDRLRDLLFEFLADAKRGVPFFSGRYLGHMNTDLLLPGLLGYFGSMLYNQNNVAGESSPLTSRLEQEVVAMLGGMVGFDVDPANPRSSGGYLTSGGTTANIYALWVARSVRSWPVSLALAVHAAATKNDVEAPLRMTADVLMRMKVQLSSGAAVPLSEASALDLWNLAIQDGACELREQAMNALLSTGQASFFKEDDRGRVVDELVGPWTLGQLGETRFAVAVADRFPAERESFSRPPLVLVPKNKHYSLPKALDLLGLGRREAMVELPLLDDFTVDPDAVRARLREAASSGTRVLAVASLFGTTEEGALDDVAAVRAVCTDSSSEGLTAWLHVDACYGGYVPCLLRQTAGGPLESAHAVASWMRKFGEAFGLDAEKAERLVSMNDPAAGWLSWKQLSDRAAALSGADSVSLDPHKLGYVPYPAGAVLLRRHSAQQTVAFDAPYLWAGEHASGSGFAGRFTLEGSRPGATSAACWLAHRAVPLSQEGHGKILAGSILAARELYEALDEVPRTVSSKVRVAFLAKPHINMLCYTPYHLESESLEEIEAVCERVAAELDPRRQGAFMAVSTEVDVRPTSDWLQKRFDRVVADRLVQQLASRGACGFKVLRSVVMGPLALEASTRPDRDGTRPLVEAFAEHLTHLTVEAFTAVRVRNLSDSFAPHEPLLVVDDDPSVADYLRAALTMLKADRLAGFVRSAATHVEALEVVKNWDIPLRFAFLDIDLAGHQEGYDVFQAICDRNEKCEPALRVESVVFFTIGAGRHDETVKSLCDGRVHTPLTTSFLKPSDEQKAQFLEDLRAWLDQTMKRRSARPPAASM